MVSFTPLPLNPGERATGTQLVGGWVDPTAGLDARNAYSLTTMCEPTV
jgi:hypothetical protein